MNKIIYGGRGTGKTHQLLLTAKDSGIDTVILTANKRGLMAKAHAYGITGLNIVDISDLQNNPEDYMNKNFMLHDINTLLNNWFETNFNAEIEGMTLTVGD